MCLFFSLFIFFWSLIASLSPADLSETDEAGMADRLLRRGRNLPVRRHLLRYLCLRGATAVGLGGLQDTGGG